jgi:transcription elongation factor Elf1
MKKKDEKILTCPFCGGIKVNICRTNANACWVECVYCFAQTDSRKTRRGAINVWNKRVRITCEAWINDDDDKEFQERLHAAVTAQ